MNSHQPFQLMGPQDKPASINQAGYPVNSLPSLLREVTQGLHENTQIPIEMIGSTVLSAASLACQSLIEVIPPYTQEPEQCSLYFLTIAESGEGKTTIFKPIMKPFYEFSTEMKREYQQQLAEYKKHHDNTISTLEYRTENSNYDKSTEAIEKLQAMTSVLLEKQKEQFYRNSSKKKTLRLSEEAVELWKENSVKIRQRITFGNTWEHIKPIASKAGSNAIRLAAIFQYITDEKSNEITRETLDCAYSCVIWHLDQASALFYPMSDKFKFMQDVDDLLSWMKVKFEKINNCPFKKNEIEKFGPNRLRRVEKLEPILNQLISMRLICVFTHTGNPTLYIAMSPDNGLNYIGIRPSDRWTTAIVSSWENTSGRYQPLRF